MAARTQLLLTGYVFPLAFGSLLLSAAVALAIPGDGPDWSQPGGTQHLTKGCKQSLGNHPGGCCAYGPNQCSQVVAQNDQQLTGMANGSTNTKIDPGNWKKWGHCVAPGEGVQPAPCNEHAWLKCAYMDFYNGGAGECNPPVTHSVMVTVQNACKDFPNN